MTLRELYDQVAHLGFETEIEYDAMFREQAYNAMIEISLSRPDVRQYEIVQTPPENLLRDAGMKVHSKEDIVFGVTGGKAFCFKFKGHVTCLVKATIGGVFQTVATIDDEASAPTVKRGFFASYYGVPADEGEPVQLVFTGSNRYAVFDVAIYGESLGGNVTDIPVYGKYIEYPLRSLIPDFGLLASPPLCESETGEPVDADDIQIENGGIIRLSQRLFGRFFVRYRHMPQKMGEEDDEVLDIDETSASLLPLLVASVLWLEDEPELAQYYRSLYERKSAMISSAETDFTDIAVRSVNNW